MASVRSSFRLQAARDRPRDLHDLHGVGQAGAVVVAHRRDEDLGLVLEPAERLGVDDAVAVELVRRPHRIGLLRADRDRGSRASGAANLLRQSSSRSSGAPANFGVGAGRPVEHGIRQRSVGVNRNRRLGGRQAGDRDAAR